MGQVFSITVDGLVKTYPIAGFFGRRRAVLDNLSFTINHGDRLGIIGRNGAGKTTLLQILAGIASPSAGRVDVKGHITSIFTLGIGLRDDLSGRENILIDAEMQGKSSAAARGMLQQIADFADLGDFIDQPVRTYSTGMKARLAFAMIVHIDPEILIIDEALSVGDNKFARKAMQKMQELSARGGIVILVSHAMAAVREMCNRCIWLERGQIKMDGTPEAVTAAYLAQMQQEQQQRGLNLLAKQNLSHSHLAGHHIIELDFSAANQSRISHLQTGVASYLSIQAEAPPGQAVRYSLDIARLDGLLLNRQESPDYYADSEGRVTARIDFGELPLNQGYYVFTLSQRCQGELAASQRIAIEVINPDPPSGGKPMLIYPTNLLIEKMPA